MSNLKLLQVMLLLISARIPRLFLSRLAQDFARFCNGGFLPALAQQKITHWRLIGISIFRPEQYNFFHVKPYQIQPRSIRRKIRQRKWAEMSLTQPVKELQKCCTKPLPSLCFARLRRPRYSPLAAFLLLSRSHAFCFFFCFAFFSGISLRKRDCSQS